MMGTRVCKGTVEYFPPLAGDPPGPIVACIVSGAAAEAMVDGDVLCLAETPKQNITLERLYVPAVIELIADAKEFSRLFTGFLHGGGFLYGQAERLLAQNVHAMLQAGKYHIGMEMHRRYEHRQIGAVFGKKCVQSRINRDLPLPYLRHALCKIGINITNGRKLRPHILRRQSFYIQPAVSARPYKHNARPCF